MLHKREILYSVSVQKLACISELTVHNNIDDNIIVTKPTMMMVIPMKQVKVALTWLETNICTGPASAKKPICKVDSRQ